MKRQKRLASIEEDTTHDLKSLCEYFTKLHSAWEIMCLPTNSLIKLRRQLKTTCDLHEAREK